MATLELKPKNGKLRFTKFQNLLLNIAGGLSLKSLTASERRLCRRNVGSNWEKELFGDQSSK